MPRKRRWLRTDEYADVESSLKKAAATAALVDSDASEWKWLLVSVHAATQGMFVVSLAFGNGLLALKATHASAWCKAYQSGAPYPARLDLDYFLALYQKAKELLFSGKLADSRFSATAEHDAAIKKLNELRNGFVHFAPQGWSIELAGLPTVCLRCLELVEHLGWQSHVVAWRSLAQSKRTHRSLRRLRRRLCLLDREYRAALVTKRSSYSTSTRQPPA
ncbi:MAG: hypothetical protein FJW38_31690 [Acidobacteria bacterium]|nr:hypothetical protein [Acidobacteriota bacterium]